MKRGSIHLTFLCITVCLLIVTLSQAYQLQQNRQLVLAVGAVPTVIDQLPKSITPGTASSVGPNTHAGIILATATALSAGGQFETAETLLVKLIDGQPFQPLGQAARFNLANHYLREGLRKDLPGAQARPLIEIAKQRYRDLLRVNSADWDARVNLEYALRVAPELANSARGNIKPVKSVNVIVPDFKLKDLP